MKAPEKRRPERSIFVCFRTSPQGREELKVLADGMGLSVQGYLEVRAFGELRGRPPGNFEDRDLFDDQVQAAMVASMQVEQPPLDEEFPMTG